MMKVKVMIVSFCCGSPRKWPEPGIYKPTAHNAGGHFHAVGEAPKGYPPAVEMHATKCATIKMQFCTIQTIYKIHNLTICPFMTLIILNYFKLS
jgi:hypothetical protein